MTRPRPLSHFTSERRLAAGERSPARAAASGSPDQRGQAVVNVYTVRPTADQLLSFAPHAPAIYRPVMLAIAGGTPVVWAIPQPEKFVLPAFGGRAWIMVVRDANGSGPSAWHGKSLKKVFRKAGEVHLVTIEPPQPLAYEMAAHGASDEKRNALLIETTEEATGMWTDFLRRVAPELVQKFITEGGRA